MSISLKGPLLISSKYCTILGYQYYSWYNHELKNCELDQVVTVRPSGPR